MKTKQTRGFTLIEILVVIGMLAILSTAVLVAVNPLRQFAEARNSQRQNDVAAILNAVSERIADNGGNFLQPPTGRTDGCSIPLPATASAMSKQTLDLRPCLVPTYISELPVDPGNGVNTCRANDCSPQNETYSTGYTVSQDATSNRITVCAPGSAETAISGSQPFCLTR